MLNIKSLKNRNSLFVLLAASLIYSGVYGCSGGEDAGMDGGMSDNIATGSNSVDNPYTKIWTSVQILTIPNALGLLTPHVQAMPDSSGNLHVVYFDDRNYPSYGINHVVWNRDTLLKTTEESIINVDNCRSLGFAIDQYDTPVVAYQGGISRSMGQEEQSDVMINIKENNWKEYTGAIGFVERQIPAYQDGLAGADISVAFDKPDGGIHICYQFFYEGIDSLNYAYPDLGYVKKDRYNLSADVPEETIEGNLFNANGTASLQNNAGAHCSIALDGNSNPVVFYYAEEFFTGESRVKNQGLKVARKQNGVWETDWIETDVEIGAISKPVFDNFGNLAIAYYVRNNLKKDEDNCLKYAHEQTASSWNVELVDDSIRAGKYASLAFDAFGQPAIAYYAEESYAGRPLENLRLARFQNNVWWQDDVATMGDIGLYNSLFFDKNDNPLITTYSETDKAVYVFY